MCFFWVGLISNVNSAPHKLLTAPLNHLDTTVKLTDVLLLSCGERILLLLGRRELLHCQSAGPLEQLQYMKLLSDIKHLHLFIVIYAKASEAYANVTNNYFSRITSKAAELYCGTLLQTKVFQS